MTPIDWREVFSNALWVLGCAIALSTLSYADWRADRNHEKLRDQFAKPKYRIAIEIALILICLGLAATSSSTLTLIIWLILTSVSIMQAMRDWQELRRLAKHQSH